MQQESAAQPDPQVSRFCLEGWQAKKMGMGGGGGCLKVLCEQFN